MSLPHPRSNSSVTHILRMDIKHSQLLFMNLQDPKVGTVLLIVSEHGKQ